LIVVLLTFEGISPGETMAARAVGTSLGSALALIAYVVWPTWERGRVGTALATMLSAYRRYFLAVLDESPRVRDDVRRASRSARSNAQASLDRLRGEPHRNARLVALSEGVFANANRFVRAAMALEAIRLTSGIVPARDAVHAFAAQVDAHLARIEQCLRNGTTAPVPSTLRAAHGRLSHALDAAAADENERVLAAAWIDAGDRITDSVDTLTHLLRASRTNLSA
jgi:uncharacterized membrane protein YccC